MNIGILGWWHYNNQGDLRILKCMEQALAPHRLVPIDLPFSLTPDSLRRLNLLDYLILGGGGLFQAAPPPPFDTFDAWGGQLETPIGALGVGIDEIPDHYRRVMRDLIERTCFFYVRDSVSHQLIEHPKAHLMPDLTFLSPWERTANVQGLSHDTPLCGVNLRQSPGLEMDRWIETLHSLPVRWRGIPFSTFGSWQETQTLRRLDETSSAAFSPAAYDDLTLMVGMAFHSVIFAIQAAVPVIAVAYAPKVKRFMDDIGLKDYVLDPDEWYKLPSLVERVLQERNQLVGRMRQITATLTTGARQTVADVRKEMERTVARPTLKSPKASIVILGSAPGASDQTTIESCLGQTYENLEVIFVADEAQVDRRSEVKIVPCDPAASWGERLNHGLAHATGEYLSWIVSGNLYARDAIAYMADSLQRDPACDMVFTDYYAIKQAQLISDVYPTDSASKLYRRNVVGPCFLYRRGLAEAAGSFRADVCLPDYDYWLRAHTLGSLRPVHTRLFYAAVTNLDGRDRRAERCVRRQWRSDWPWPARAFWRVVDTDLAEDWVVRPALAIRRRLCTRLAGGSE